LRKIDRNIKKTLENLEKLYYNMKHIKQGFGKNLISYCLRRKTSWLN
jgi:hypothetical protein